MSPQLNGALLLPRRESTCTGRNACARLKTELVHSTEQPNLRDKESSSIGNLPDAASRIEMFQRNESVRECFGARVNKLVVCSRYRSCRQYAEGQSGRSGRRVRSRAAPLAWHSSVTRSSLDTRKPSNSNFPSTASRRLLPLSLRILRRRELR